MKKHWNVAVCDDDRAALSILRSAVEQAFQAHEAEATVEVFPGPAELLKRMGECRFDLLFLDIEMPNLDGLSVGRQLRRQNNLIDIIFISNREDLVFDALRINPRGFIRKSRFLQDVTGVVDSYFASLPQEEAVELLIQDGGQIRSVPVQHLMYIEGAGKFQLLHLSDTPAPVRVSRQLQDLEDELSGVGFLRIHKGYLVNYRYIRRIDSAEVLLDNGETLPISRRKAQETRQAYLELMQSGGSMVL